MRVLIMTTAVGTHFTPLVPLAWGLRAAGHDVLVVGQPDVVATVRSAGLVAASVGRRFDMVGYLREKLPAGKRPAEVFPRPRPDQMAMFGRVWMAHARTLLPDHLALARDLRPQLIVADQLEYTSLIVGGVLGVPVLHHRWGIDPISDQALLEARTELLDLAVDAGLDELPAPVEKLDPCPPSLQLPTAMPGTPIRYVPFNGTAELPDWVRRGRPDGVGRRVAVSLGTFTLELNGVPYARRVLTACAALPDTEVIATVDDRHRAEIGPLPPAVRVVPPTPLHLFMDSCDAVVHHGGAGTTLTAVAAGLPQLVLPQWADTFASGERLQAVGAGLSVEGAAGQDDPEAVRGAVERLLDEPGYRKAAQELQAEMAGMPSPGQVAAEVVQRWVPGAAA
jgi:glycosyltransferase